MLEVVSISGEYGLVSAFFYSMGWLTAICTTMYRLRFRCKEETKYRVEKTDLTKENRIVHTGSLTLEHMRFLLTKKGLHSCNFFFCSVFFFFVSSGFRVSGICYLLTSAVNAVGGEGWGAKKRGKWAKESLVERKREVNPIIGCVSSSKKADWLLPTFSYVWKVIREPVQSLVKSISFCSTACLHIPLAVHRRQFKFLSEFGYAHGIRQILLVSKYQNRCILQLLLVEHFLQLLARFDCTIPIIAVHHKDQTLGVLEIMTPQGTDLERDRKIVAKKCHHKTSEEKPEHEFCHFEMAIQSTLS